MSDTIERINELLRMKYGREFGDESRWRVVRAGEQFEKRWMTHTDNGVELLFREVREVRKYQHIEPQVYVLERLVPVVGETDLTTKTSYEPAWSFLDAQGNALPPRYDACEFIIDAIYSQQDKANTHTKYKDGENKETLQARIDAVEQELFGNETPVGDALAHRYGVAGFHPKEVQMSNFGARQVGEFIQQRPIIRSSRNPLDKATIISIYPKELHYEAYTIFPGKFVVEPGTFDKPSVTLIDPTSWFKDVHEDQPMLEIPVSATQLAHSIISDSCSGLLAASLDGAMPGMFFIPGTTTVGEVKLKYKANLDDSKSKQDNWFRILVKLGDSLWARGNGNPLVIWDEMRLAARELSLDKPWVKDFQATELVRCFACGNLRNPEYPVCSTCKAIDNTHPAAKGLQFAR